MGVIADISIDMYIDVLIATCIDMYIDPPINMCMDMYIGVDSLPTSELSSTLSSPKVSEFEASLRRLSDGTAQQIPQAHV